MREVKKSGRVGKQDLADRVIALDAHEFGGSTRTAKKKTDFEVLVGRIQATLDALRQDALVIINRSVTARAWLTGYYIVEYEQHGADWAKYGEGLLKKLAARLNDDKIRLSSLKSYRQFFRIYPELTEPVRAYLISRFGGECSLPKQISQTLSGFSDGNQILLISGKGARGH